MPQRRRRPPYREVSFSAVLYAVTLAALAAFAAVLAPRWIGDNTGLVILAVAAVVLTLLAAAWDFSCGIEEGFQEPGIQHSTQCEVSFGLAGRQCLVPFVDVS